MKARTALLLVFLLLATAALLVKSHKMLDPLDAFRGPDGQLRIPGRALTPELQQLLFQGNRVQAFHDITFLVAQHSPYPTAHVTPIAFPAPNLNVFDHRNSESRSAGDSIGRLLRAWFPPVNWHAVGTEIVASARQGIGSIFDLVTVNARADTVGVDSTTVASVDPAAATCTTSQSAAPESNAILVMLSNRNAASYTTVTYGAVSLALIPGTASSGTGFVRTEMWFYQGPIPSGAQTMTATLTSGTADHVCATILLRGVASSSPTVGGTTSSGTTTNPNIAISPAAGQLAFAVMAIRGTTGPTAVTGTGATATSLYGVAPTRCTTGGNSLCAAGASMPNPGTAITWTDGNATDWVVAAVSVVAAPNCNVAAGNCYRVGAGGAWNTGANWSNSSGGANCGCTPTATSHAIFNATPTGTTTLAAATTIASIDMTGFTGTLDTTASNWALTINGPFAVQGTFLARNSTVTVTGDVDILTAATIVNLGASTWTVNGRWTNASTSASWNAGTSTMTFNSATGGTMTFAGTNLPGAEFNNVTFTSSAGSPQTFTMATRALFWSGTLTVSDASSTTALATANLGLTGGALNVGNGGIFTANASTVTVSGVTMTGGASGTITLTTSDFTSTGNWDTGGAGSVFTKGTSTVTMSGVSNIAILNASNNFNNLTISAAGTVTQTGLVDVSGTLTVNAGAVLATGTFTLAVAGLAANMAGGITAGAAGTKTITGNVSIAVAGFFSFGGATWNFGGSWTNSSTSGSWAVGTGTVVFNSSASRTMTFANLGVSEFNNVQFSPTAAATFTMATNGLRWGGTLTLNNNATLSTANLALTGTAGNLTVNDGATLTAGTSAVSVTNVTMTGGTSGTIAASGSWTVAGNWDTSGAGSVFTGPSSTVILNGAARTVRILNPSNGFGALTISGSVSAASAIGLAGLLTVSGTFDTTATSYDLTVGNGLTISGAGILRTNASVVSISGNVNVNNPSGYITSAAAGSWTASGAWTNASTSALWSFSAPITFNASASQTMTFAALPAAAAEFNDVTFNSDASTVTFTMATNGLVWSGTLTVQGGSGATTLATANLDLSGGAVVVGDAGLLTADASTIDVSDVTMAGAVSGTIALTTGTWTVRGNWDSSGAGSTLASGGSTLTFTGSSKSIALAPGQSFHHLTIAGTIVLSSTVTAAGTLTINNGAVLTKTGQSIAFNALTEIGTGSIADGVINVVNFSVTNSDSTNLTTISVFTIWNTDAEYNWTHSSTVGTSTITFAIGGNTIGYRFDVTKDAVDFTNGLVDGSGQVIFAMTGADPVVDVLISSPCGADRYWIGGTGDWSQPSHWAASSGGVNGCSVPTSTTLVFFDAASGGGIATVNLNAAMRSLITTGWTGTIAIGSFDFAVSGDITHAAGIISIGASSGNGLTASGNLTLSGFAVLDGSGAASVVGVSGDASIASATAYVRMGNGTWTFGGSWSNGSTSTNWDAGTGQVLFNSSSSQTMSFANLAAAEFHHITFQSTAGSGTVTFTMASNGLRWSGLLTIRDPAGSTSVLATASLPLTGGSLAVGNEGVLSANGSAASLIDVTMNGGSSGMIVLTTATWSVSGNWDTSGAGSTFAKGTSTVVLSGATATVATLDSANGFHNLTISGAVAQASAIDVRATLSILGTLTTSGNDITGGASLVVSGGGSLIASTSSITVAAVTMNDASANSISLTSGSIWASASWDTSGASSAFSAGASTVTLTAASGTLTTRSSQPFMALVVTGNLSLASPLTVSSLTISAGGLANGAHSLTVNGNLTLAGGYLTSTSGSVFVTGNVTVSSASSYIAFGSEAWTVSGSWTNASTSASWSSGTATVTFNAASSQVMTFAGANLSGNEFSTVVFNGGSAIVTFTMASRGLVANAVMVQGATGTTTLTTSASNLPLTAGTLTVGGGGSLTANGSLLTVRSMNTSAGAFAAGTSTVAVNGSGGSIQVAQTLYNLIVNPGVSTSFISSITWSRVLTLTGATAVFSGNLASTGPAATITFGSSTISIAGSWNTSSATAFTSTGSSVTFTGTGGSITSGPGQPFASLTIAGTVALGADLTATSLTVAGSGTLTMTNYGITFNALSVAGTIVDGPVNVSGLAVANSNSTALVTITAFAAWSVGSSYAWTHASNETSQTITWTIGGNAIGAPFAVTKDGSPFAGGTVDGSGQVVFTMLGSDPDMQVTVGTPVVVPPPSGWWQTSYWFVILPTGILLGVAMFAQRQRWRPAKAFLVDERGKMLREFTLDPSCQVSYDQAVEAGVLDAVEKPIKVAKYRGQTVRGDALAVVLLAYGPISLEQVEFAREILVQVQDKFEDAVKQRLEEARARDAELDGRTQQLEERRLGIDSRTAELDARQRENEEAQSKLSTEAAGLAAKEEDLRRRETQLADERKAIDNLAAQTEVLRADLDGRTATIQSEAAEVAKRSESVRTREIAVGEVEAQLHERDQSIAQTEARLAAEQERIAVEASTIQGRIQEVEARESAVRQDLEGLAQGRARFEEEQKDLLEFKRSVDTRVADVEKSEAAAAERTKELDAREAGLAPSEAALASREAVVAKAEGEYKSRKAELDASLSEIAERTRDLEARETGVKEDQIVLEEARVAFDSERREFQDRTAHFEDEIRRRHADLDAQGKDIGEQQLRLAQEKETFEAARNEKNQAMLAREIEVEAREQSLLEKEDAVRSQAEDNARRLTDLAGREETMEIENAKLDKGRAELDTRKGELANLAKELGGKAARLRDEEAQRAEELRTWQTTLESQQALLKEQRETFEQESVSQRESWATRVMRLERREIEVKDQEEKVREDVEWVARTQEELARRERAAQDALQSASLMKAEGEALKNEVEQRSLEIDSKERALREEATRHATELSERTDALNALETEINSKRTELEKDRVAQTQRIHQMDIDLQKNAQALEAKERGLAEREDRVVAMEESIRANESRLVQERAAVQATGEQLEAHQLELSQLKDRYEVESSRVRTEAEAIAQSLAVKEAEMRAEREAIERDASALQDTLGAKAKEMAIREKALSAREGELRSEEEDLEARTRELESKEQQVEARLTELSAQAMALVRREQDLNARDAQFEQTAKKFHSEEAEKRKQWESLQTTLRSQEAQLNATTETRAAEMTKRAEDLDGRERAWRAATTHLELERSKLEAQAKAHAAKSAEADAAWRRSETRLAELKAKEDELLRARQSFESERSVWSTKRSEELKQLEATRDAVAVHGQQAERLVAESQRRTLIAEEAEKSAKRQAADLVAQQTLLERRRSEADKAERTAQEQLAQLQEMSRIVTARKKEVDAAERDIGARQTRLTSSEKELGAAMTDLRNRKAMLEQESTRLATLSDQLAGRQKDLDSRTATLEGKLGQVTTKEQTLATELQRADNLMEDLGRKDRDLRARAAAANALEAELSRQQTQLADRDAQLSEGQRNLDKMRQEIEVQHSRAQEDLRTTSTARAEAEKLRVQADAMQGEVSKNLRFLQKKALDVLDREEKLREREAGVEQKERGLDARAEILEGKERAMEADQSESDSKAAKLHAEVDRLRARLTEIEKAGGPSSTAMEEWKKDVENRVKIIQKKAMDLLDREQRLREKEEELRALAQQLGVTL